jgi:hypothetical protein
MGDRQAQHFWDDMWLFERYDIFPGEADDDPHLVIILGAQVDQAVGNGQEPDPEVFRRFDACVGRILNRFESRFPRSGEAVDIDEFKNWLRFGLDPAHRGKDGVATPIIDANSLVIFLRFVRYARAFCERHQLTELGALWSSIEAAAQEVENERLRTPRPSRFEAPVS